MAELDLQVGNLDDFHVLLIIIAPQLLRKVNIVEFMICVGSGNLPADLRSEKLEN